MQNNKDRTHLGFAVSFHLALYLTAATKQLSAADDYLGCDNILSKSKIVQSLSRYAICLKKQPSPVRLCQACTWTLRIEIHFSAEPPKAVARTSLVLSWRAESERVGRPVCQADRRLKELNDFSSSKKTCQSGRDGALWWELNDQFPAFAAI